jgi:hypothetical protein
LRQAEQIAGMRMEDIEVPDVGEPQPVADSSGSPLEQQVHPPEGEPTPLEEEQIGVEETDASGNTSFDESAAPEESAESFESAPGEEESISWDEEPSFTGEETAPMETGSASPPQPTFEPAEVWTVGGEVTPITAEGATPVGGAGITTTPVVPPVKSIPLQSGGHAATSVGSGAGTAGATGAAGAGAVLGLTAAVVGGAALAAVAVGAAGAAEEGGDHCDEGWSWCGGGASIYEWANKVCCKTHWITAGGYGLSGGVWGAYYVRGQGCFDSAQSVVNYIVHHHISAYDVAPCVDTRKN